ncbi:MAG: hypothetical protein WC676_04580 [Candidatus Omnitrophota bacterium]
MAKIDLKELLKDKRVVEEINRHLWIESEKAGYDIGFEKAAEDWLKRFSAEWVKFHATNGADAKKARSAKSYFK